MIVEVQYKKQYFNTKYKLLNTSKNKTKYKPRHQNGWFFNEV